jgi:malate permease and related proteins
MGNFLLLGACFVLGMVLRQSGRLPDNAPAALNGFVLNVSLPALTLVYVHELSLSGLLIYPILMPWIMFGIGCAFFYGIGRWLNLPPATTGALMLTGSLGNTSFLGLPMIETFFGPQGLAIGILIDQAGTYLVLSTFGITIAAMYAARGTGFSAKSVLRKIAGFMPFISLIVALALIPVTYPEWLTDVLKRLGATLVPLALVSVGYQIRLSAVRGKARLLGIGLAFKLVAAPALIAGLYGALIGFESEEIRITIFEAAMAPQIGAAIVAMEHDLDPPLVTLMVGIGIPLSFLTVPLWAWMLSAVA